MVKRIKVTTKKAALTPAEKRANMYKEVRSSLVKIKKGEELSERELQLVSKCYTAFMELFDVFKPSIKTTLLEQQAKIEEAIASYEEDEDDED